MSISHSVTLPSQFSVNAKQEICPEAEKITLLIDKSRSFKHLSKIHGFIIRHGFERDPSLNFKLQRAYASLGRVKVALALFNRTSNPNVYFYSSIIHGHAINGLYDDALCLYVKMLTESVEPNEFTMSSVIKVCTLESGKAIHGHAVKFGYEANDYVRATLVGVYARCGEFVAAHRLLNRINGRNWVATTALISGYAACGDIDKARIMFDMMEERDIASWNVMIDGYAKHGKPNEALILFRQMLKSGMKPNEATLVAALSACGQVGALESGKWIHSYLSSTALENVQIATALIDMYSKSGSLEDAKKVFDGIKLKDIVAYNTMIGGYSLHGQGKDALRLFSKMCSIGLHPTDITFIAVLSACAHSGFVSEARAIFDSMKDEYEIEPKVEHYGCMVNLLGRAGQLDEAYDLVVNMSIDPDHVLWCTLLSACKLHKNTLLAEGITQLLLDHGHAGSGTFVLLSNIYASFGDWDGVARARNMMRQSGLHKEPGSSSIEVNNRVHEFLAGDLKHPRSKEIYLTLEKINEWLRDHSYIPQTDAALHDTGDMEKKRSLEVHSERLALAFGLLSTKQGSRIKIIKNLRVCEDCHGVFKLVSKITGRNIVMRDRNRFHHFVDGLCSCGDYW